MKKILIVEDEGGIARTIQLELEREGFSCICVPDGKSGLEQAVSGDYSLILLDVMLPELDGFSVLRSLRERSEVPVIMLTALGEIDDRVRGLDAGADDYLTKPFSMRELTARVRAALRVRAAATKETLIRGKLRLNPTTRRVFYGKEELAFTRKEFELLQFFMEHPNDVFTREQILRKVWGYDYMGDTNLIDVYIRYLRTKIDERYGKSFFRTVRGIGYSFEPNE